MSSSLVSDSQCSLKMYKYKVAVLFPASGSSGLIRREVGNRLLEMKHHLWLLVGHFTSRVQDYSQLHWRRHCCPGWPNFKWFRGRILSAHDQLWSYASSRAAIKGLVGMMEECSCYQTLEGTPLSSGSTSLSHREGDHYFPQSGNAGQPHATTESNHG